MEEKSKIKEFISSAYFKGVNDFMGVSEIEILSKDFFLKNLKTIGLIILLILININNRYSCQKQIAEIENLKKQLQDTRFEALTRSSELIGISRPSQVKALVKRQGINIEESNKPAYYLND